MNGAVSPRKSALPALAVSVPGQSSCLFKHIVKINPGTCILLSLSLLCDNGKIAFCFCASVPRAAGASSVSLCVCEERVGLWSNSLIYKKKKVISHQCSECLSTVLWIPTSAAACAGIKDLGASCAGPAAFLCLLRSPGLEGGLGPPSRQFGTLLECSSLQHLLQEGSGLRVFFP